MSFVIFLVAAFAETNRLPFDLPESETELVGGYNTEYSSMKFALFFHGRIREHDRRVGHDGDAVSRRLDAAVRRAWISRRRPSAIGVLHIGIFLAKILVFMVIFIWVRWMWPRFRYDQLMDLGWRRFIPLALANILITALGAVAGMRDAAKLQNDC